MTGDSHACRLHTQFCRIIFALQINTYMYTTIIDLHTYIYNYIYIKIIIIYIYKSEREGGSNFMCKSWKKTTMTTDVRMYQT